jgi:hypothetical protein
MQTPPEAEFESNRRKMIRPPAQKNRIETVNSSSCEYQAVWITFLVMYFQHLNNIVRGFSRHICNIEF